MTVKLPLIQIPHPPYLQTPIPAAYARCACHCLGALTTADIHSQPAVLREVLFVIIIITTIIITITIIILAVISRSAFLRHDWSMLSLRVV